MAFCTLQSQNTLKREVFVSKKNNKNPYQNTYPQSLWKLPRWAGAEQLAESQCKLLPSRTLYTTLLIVQTLREIWGLDPMLPKSKATSGARSGSVGQSLRKKTRGVNKEFQSNCTSEKWGFIFTTEPSSEFN